MSGSAWAALVQRPVAVTMFVLAAVVFGVVGYGRLSVELMPALRYPTLTVRTVWDGAAPQEVEDRVSRPIEEALAALDGLHRLQSRSRAGSSDVLLGFTWGTDMAKASQAIREQLQRIQLPRGVEKPLILRYDPTLEPILRLALSSGENDGGPHALAPLRAFAERHLKRELEALPGVAAVRVRGGFEREIQVRVREDWLAAQKVTVDAVRRALEAANVNRAGGSVLEGDKEFLVRTLNAFRSVEALRALQIRREDGRTVPLTAVAEVVDGYRDREALTWLDGEEAIELEIFKEADATIVEVAARVHAFFDDPEAVPEPMRVVVLDDQAAFIGAALANLRGAVLSGGLLAVGVLYLFLRDGRATGIVGLAIPVSVLVGFGPLYLLGVSLNLMSLGGLALGVGMLVDNAVVVLESIQRYREEGCGRPDAAARGVADVGMAVMASTFTTVAVFAPLAFVEGVAGELFGDLAVAVVSALLASLAVALLLVPTLAALDLRPDEPAGPQEPAVVRPSPTRRLRASWERRRGWRRWALLPYHLLRFLVEAGAAAAYFGVVVAGRTMVWGGRRIRGPARWGAAPSRYAADAFADVFSQVERGYGSLLQGVLRRSGAVVAVAVLLFMGASAASTALGTELIPSLHRGRFTVELTLPVGTPLQVTERVSAALGAQIREHPAVRTTYATVGADPRVEMRADRGEHTAQIRVELAEIREEEPVVEALRRSWDGPGQLHFTRPALFSTATPVEVVLDGDDLEELRRVGDRVVERLGVLPGLADVRSSMAPGHPEVQIVYDRVRLHRLGLDAATVASAVRDAVQGVVATELHLGRERVDVRVQLAEEDRGAVASLRRLAVDPSQRPQVPLEAVASFREAEGPSEIRRVDQRRAVVVSANLTGFDLGGAGEAIEEALRAADLPPAVGWRIAGQAAEMRQALASMGFALGLAVFLVYVIMASTFESFVRPLIILFSVPVAAVGVVPALLVAGKAVSVVVFIGLIVLAGVVVNNAIVLVDAIDRRRAEGLAVREAVMTAARLRLRPIAITTTTTVLGLAPLALGFGAGAELQQPLAVTVIGGLIGSTLLTLVLIPAAYTLVARHLPGVP